MPEIKVGLNRGKTSFFDPLTNTYMTLDNPVQIIRFDESTDLSNIVHAIMAMWPTLVLYEGKLPEEAVEAWKNKFKGLFNTNMERRWKNQKGEIVKPTQGNMALDRPDRINEASAEDVSAMQAQASTKTKDAVEQTSGKSGEPEAEQGDLFTQAVAEETLKESSEKKEQKEEKKTTTRKSNRRSAKKENEGE